MTKHGTPYRYDQGCRCDECREANSAHAREQRARRRAANRPSYQHELAATRARKERYRGTCERCGGPTDGSNGPVAAPRVCAGCAPDVYGPRYAAALRGHGPTTERVLEFIHDGERGFTEIARGCGITRGHTGNILNRLLRYGLVVRVRRGVYKKAEIADA